jgi:protoporphyrinogen oxidase
MPLQGSGAKDDRVLNAKKEFAPGGPNPETDEAVMLIRDRVSRIFYRRKFFDYPITVSASTFINMGFWNTICASVSYFASAIKKRPESSLEDFYINRFGKKLYSMFFEDYTEKVWGVHPSELSASWGAQRIKSISLWGIARESLMKTFNPAYKTSQTSLIERFYYPKLGPGQLWQALADRVLALGGKIIYNSRVDGIRTAGDRVESVSFVREGARLETPCDYLFSSMPVKALIAGMEAPPCVKEIARNLPYRDFRSVGVLVKELKIQNKTKIKTLNGRIPDCWIYVQEPDVRVGRLQIFNNWSPYMTADWENTVWIALEYFCNEGDDLWSMEDDTFIAFATRELEKLDIIEKNSVLDATQFKIEKAYPSYFGSYYQFDTVREYLDRVENLYCIGRNGQHRYNNMDHSMLTAFAAVAVAISGSKDKSAIWNINSEEEYHEKKVP